MAVTDKLSFGGGITQHVYDEYVTSLETTQQDLNDRLKALTSDIMSFQITASHLLDLAQRAEQLFQESDGGLEQKLLEYLLSNIALNDKNCLISSIHPSNSLQRQNKRPKMGQIRTFGAASPKIFSPDQR